jgi:hypothetical protein
MSNWGDMSETKPSDCPANPNCMPMSVEVYWWAGRGITDEHKEEEDAARKA